MAKSLGPVLGGGTCLVLTLNPGKTWASPLLSQGHLPSTPEEQVRGAHALVIRWVSPWLTEGQGTAGILQVGFR